MAESKNTSSIAEELKNALSLNLPDPEGFKGKAGELSLSEVFRLSEERVSLINKNEDNDLVRLRTKVDKEFKL